MGVHFNVDPNARLIEIKNELLALKAKAQVELAPARGRFPEIGTFFTKLDELISKASEYEARLKANSTLVQSDWDSLKLTPLRDSVSNLDYSHPFRNYVEQKLLSLQLKPN